VNTGRTNCKSGYKIIKQLENDELFTSQSERHFGHFGTGGLEPIDKLIVDYYSGKKEDVSPFPRINRIRKRAF
jgi:hypothetical protein